MPLYDYKCTKCSYVFEVQQRIMEDPLKHCPKCKGAIHRLISAAGIVFKGSGFHVTDYGRSKVKGAQSTDNKKAKTEEGTKKEKATETKSSGAAASHEKSK